MSDNGLLNGKAKRLNLGGGGGGGGKGMEYLLAGTLAVIIVGSLGFTIWKFFGGKTGSNTPTEMHFQCLKCKAEFELKPEEIPQPSEQAMYGPESMFIDCPKCGAKQSCLPMVQCPNPDCKKWYLPEATKFYAMNPAAAPTEELKDVCPFCNTDRIQWYREHRPRR